jgi:hypothetical protein
MSYESQWICTAKDDRGGQIHVAGAYREGEAMATQPVGIDVEDG